MSRRQACAVLDEVLAGSAALLAGGLVLLAGCAALPAPQVEVPALYLLEARPADRPAQPLSPEAKLVLAVGTPRARPGFDTSQIAYVRRSHELDYFVASRWADAPARMLAPLLVQALARHGAFRAVVPIPTPVSADLRLDTELVRLQQDFGVHPSRVDLALHVQLIDLRSRRVLASAELSEQENAAREDAYGGVMAANRALERLLVRVADFCAVHAGGR